MKKNILLILLMFLGIHSFAQTFSGVSFNNSGLCNQTAFVNNCGVSFEQDVTKPFGLRLMKNDTKTVWVDTGWGNAKIGLTIVGGIVSLISTSVLIPAIIYSMPIVTTVFGIFGGAGLIAVIIGLILPNDGYYKTVPVSIFPNTDFYTKTSFSESKLCFENSMGIKIAL